MRVWSSLFSVTAASLLLSATAFAAPANKAKLELYEQVTLQGKELGPGTYRVEWNGEGPNVQLNIAQGRHDITSVSAQVVNTDKKDSDGYVATKGASGENALTEIFFHGKTYELRIPESSSTPATQPSPGGNAR